MGMAGGYKRISSEQLQAVIDSPDLIQELVFEDELDDDTAFDVDKAWHGIHFLLHGEPWSGEGALFDVVLGGTPIGEDLGYGPVRYLTADEVAAAAQALDQVDDQELRARYSPEAFAKAEIYPDIWVREGTEALDYVMSNLEELRKFYRTAAGNGDAMLLYLC